MLAPPPVQPCAQATTTSSAPRTTLDFSNSFLLACGRGRMPGGEQAKGQRRNLRKARRRLKWGAQRMDRKTEWNQRVDLFWWH